MTALGRSGQKGSFLTATLFLIALFLTIVAAVVIMVKPSLSATTYHANPGDAMVSYALGGALLIISGVALAASGPRLIGVHYPRFVVGVHGGHLAHVSSSEARRFMRAARHADSETLATYLSRVCGTAPLDSRVRPPLEKVQRPWLPGALAIAFVALALAVSWGPTEAGWWLLAVMVVILGALAYLAFAPYRRAVLWFADAVRIAPNAPGVLA